ncbi:MAG: exo-alpha-sialidase [Saprospiraceae bacterium]|nr:exo-alpha-sialidase [Saprospiraceae bacterium]
MKLIIFSLITLLIQPGNNIKVQSSDLRMIPDDRVCCNRLAGDDDAEDERFILHQDVVEISNLTKGPFIFTNAHEILTVEDSVSLISSDGGKSWNAYQMFSHPGLYQVSKERALIKTKSGVIILAFINMKELANWNWQADISDSPGATAPTYVVRSLDGGKSWEKPEKLHNEWTGAIRNMIQTRSGNIIFTSMMMRHNPGHHTVLTYMSRNDGESWERSNIIDLGGIGHHSGVTEGTIEQLKDGRIWLLMRTNWGSFWEATSSNEGLLWENIRPTSIAASSAPGILKRLQSGRLMLIWNRRFPEGEDNFPMTGGDRQWSEVATSNHRQEMSVSFSEDEGKSWSKPVVLAKVKDRKNQISYPYVFEIEPGTIWLTTMYGELRIQFKEVDFVN